MRVAILIVILTSATCGPSRQIDDPGAETPTPTPTEQTEETTGSAVSVYDRVLVRLADGVELGEFRNRSTLPAPVSEARASVAGWSLLTFEATDPPRGEQEQARLVEDLKALPDVEDANPDEKRQVR